VVRRGRSAIGPSGRCVSVLASRAVSIPSLLLAVAHIAGMRQLMVSGYWLRELGCGHRPPALWPRQEALDDGRDGEGDTPLGSTRFVTDVEESVCAARTAAGDRAVLVHGASAAQALLRARLLDEMQIHLVQVLLGEGRRLFDGLGRSRVELELVRRLDDHDVTHLRYRVIGPGNERR
jgi:hypothetical protein